MFMSYGMLDTWLGIVIGGLAGCLGLWVVLYVLAKVPFAALGGNPGKLLWSVLFMIPTPFILALFPYPLSLLVALIWLSVGPTSATKFYFGPKTAKWGKTIGFNLIYAVVALLVYWLIKTYV